MADGVIITSGTGVTIATDDDGSAQHQWVKIEIGANGSFVPVTTANGLPVQILSLPAFAVGSAVAITSLPALTAASATVTNLGTFAVQVTSLPNFAIGTSVLATVTNAGTFAVQVTSLPAFAVGAITSVSNGTIVSVTNLVSVLVSDNAYRFVVGQAAPISGYWRFTSTYTSAQTNVVLVALPASTTALHLTDCIFSCAHTHGSFTLLESPSNGAVRTALDRVYFRDYGGAVLNFSRPLVLDTNSALLMTSRSATDQSVTVIGYAQ